MGRGSRRGARRRLMPAFSTAAAPAAAPAAAGAAAVVVAAGRVVTVGSRWWPARTALAGAGAYAETATHTDAHAPDAHAHTRAAALAVALGRPPMRHSRMPPEPPAQPVPPVPLAWPRAKGIATGVGTRRRRGRWRVRGCACRRGHSKGAAEGCCAQALAPVSKVGHSQEQTQDH